MVLENADRKAYADIKGLYKRAFPRDERAPFFLIKRRAVKGKAQMLAAKEGDIFVGFVYLVCYKDLVYLFYFAVEENYRGTGKGSEILRLLKERCAGRRLFLAREQLDEKAENYSQRVNRHRFYRKNGFEDLPCRIKEASVVYDVMGIGGNVSAEEYDALIDCWIGRFLKKLIDMRIIEEAD